MVVALIIVTLVNALFANRVLPPHRLVTEAVSRCVHVLGLSKCLYLGWAVLPKRQPNTARSEPWANFGLVRVSAPGLDVTLDLSPGAKVDSEQVVPRKG